MANTYLIRKNSLGVGTAELPFDKAIFKGDLIAVTDTAVGGLIKLENTTGKDLWITLFLIDVTTPSTGAATVDIGVDDVGDTSVDDLIDGGDVNTAAIVLNNLVSGGTKGTIVKWPSGHFITATASASLAGIVGKYHVEAVPV